MDGHKADKLLNFSLLLFAATCILSITLSEAALVLMLAAILWKAFTSPEGFRQPLAELHANPLVFPLAVYLLVYIFSSIFSLDPARSWGRLDTEIIKALSAVLVFSSVSRSGRKKAALWFVAGATASALIGLWQFGAGLATVTQGAQIRAHGTMIAVTYAEVTGLALLLSLLKLSGSVGTERKLLRGAFVILTAGFAASLSRGPVLGLLPALGILFLLKADSRRHVLAAAAIIFLVFSVSALLNENSRSRMTSAVSYISEEKPAEKAEKLDYAANARITEWKAGAAIFRDFPLTGTGPYSLRKTFNRYHRTPIDGVIDYPDVHNIYLQRAADSGIPGLLALLLLFGTILKSSLACYLRSRDIYSLWGLAAFSGFAVMMGTDSSFDLPRVSFCVYFLAAMSGPAGRTPDSLRP
ncbi:MAG: O-antigen ligase family protein [Elusimicrobiales bacterium]